MKLRKRRKIFLIPLFSTSDIAFLLLIFIMLVSLINYRKEVHIEYAYAQAAPGVNTEKNLEIWINTEGMIFLDGYASSINALRERITYLFINAPDTRVHILADRNTPYYRINAVLEVMQTLQYRTVSFVVKTDE